MELLGEVEVETLYTVAKTVYYWDSNLGEDKSKTFYKGRGTPSHPIVWHEDIDTAYHELDYEKIKHEKKLCVGTSKSGEMWVHLKGDEDKTPTEFKHSHNCFEIFILNFKRVNGVNDYSFMETADTKIKTNEEFYRVVRLKWKDPDKHKSDPFTIKVNGNYKVEFLQNIDKKGKENWVVDNPITGVSYLTSKEALEVVKSLQDKAKRKDIDWLYFYAVIPFETIEENIEIIN